MQANNNELQHGSNNGQQPVASLNERELTAVRMHYLGKSSAEIAQVTGWNASHVRRLFMNGGRLEAEYNRYAEAMSKATQEGAATALEQAKQEAQAAMQRMVALSRDPKNGPVCYKANEYLLNLGGVATKQATTLRSFFEGKSYEQICEMIDAVSQELYGKKCSVRAWLDIVRECSEEKRKAENPAEN